MPDSVHVGTNQRDTYNRDEQPDAGRTDDCLNERRTAYAREQLPDDATWDDVIERIRFRQAVAEGKAAADRSEFASEDEVRRVFAKYGVKT